jgi:hypothetical protein
MWHRPSNLLALAEIDGGLPLLLILDDDFDGLNPFYSYPLSSLKYYGWEIVGEAD